MNADNNFTVAKNTPQPLQPNRIAVAEANYLMACRKLLAERYNRTLDPATLARYKALGERLEAAGLTAIK